jgi:hypothetical protein
VAGAPNVTWAGRPGGFRHRAYGLIKINNANRRQSDFAKWVAVFGLAFSRPPAFPEGLRLFP